MRATILLLLMFASSLLATNVHSQVAKVNISVKNSSVIQVLRTIESQTDYLFVYDKNEIDLTREVNLETGSHAVSEILSEMFSETNVVFAMNGSNIMLMVKPSGVQQQKTISGKVTDNTGAPLPGVSVVIKGTTNGTITDANGNYSLIGVQSKATLQYSFVGMKSEEVVVDNKSVINVSLSEEAIGIEEVVAVGYGSQRKESVTGSVASMGGDKLRDVPSSNISQALQGRVSGVEMSQTSSKPGSTMQIRIRGTRSLNASNDPLVVLDGIPFAGSISDISTDDIKSIDILKDASATAIYGSRGANGVILVTSNKGKKGQDAHLSYNGYEGLRTVFAKYPMMNGPEFVALRAASNQFKNTIDEADDVNTDWQDLLYKNGTISNHDIGVSGGSTKGSYNFGLGYFKDQAVIPLQNFTRYSFRASLDQEIGEYFRVGFSSNSNYSVNNGNNLGAVGNALARSPIANIHNADGTLKTRIQESTSGAQWVSTRSTIEALGDQYIDQTKAYGSYNSAYAEVKIPGVEGLKARVNLGLNYRQSNYGNYTGVGVFSGTPTNPSTASISNEHTTNWAVENLLTYDRVFAEKHKINAVAMYSAEQTTYNKSQVSAKNLPADFFQFYNLGRAASTDITVDPNNQLYTQSGLMSYMGRVMYSYDDRYMLSATFRSDASSRLAAGHKWHSYPAVSVGWNIGKEAFMQDIYWLESLKLRAGYGQTSNQAVDPYKTLGLMSANPYNFGSSTYSTGFSVTNLPNPKLGWEFSTTYNFGVDFSFLKNRISGTAEYYSMNTKNVLLSVGMPSSSGVSSYMANVGETGNKGFELSLNGTILDNLNGWTWEVGVNVYANHNKLLALASGADRDEGNSWFKGHPIDAVYDFKKIGLWQADDKFQSILEPGGNVGMIKVKYAGDYYKEGDNIPTGRQVGDPVRSIGAADRQIMDITPDFQGGFNTRVAYKGFDLSVIGTFKSGGIVMSTLYGGASYLNNLNTRSGNNVKVDYWTPTNTGAKYPKPNGVGGDNPKYASTLGYFNASYMKVRTITLGYNVNPKLLRFAHVEKLRIYGTVENPFVLFSPYTKESGMDPETNSYGNENAAVPLSNSQRRLLTIAVNTPTTRNYLVGINVTF
ncbi:MAG TPA: TonB-dependent receptor [Prolixibacteraceae bacterium]|nr:TonB-dependent receptor [Prolixibacteraceae bacterium]HPR85149.1 TonB-dependent receptor [Prolixibacteraceae bacterium]